MTQTRAEWLDERRKGCGGSDIAAIMGLSPWKTQYQIYLEKRGEAQETEEPEWMSWRRNLEGPLRQFYSDKTGRAVRLPEGIIYHPKYPFMLANLDGLTDCRRVVELKTARYSKEWGKPGTDEIPDSYNLQVQHYLCVTGFEVADIVVSVGLEPPVLYEVHADPELQEMIIAACTEFWALVVAGTPPPIVSFSDAVLKYGKQDATGIVFASSELVLAIEGLHKTKEQQKELEIQEEALKAQVIIALGDKGDSLVDSSGKTLCTYKIAKGRETIDAKGLAVGYPEIYAKYLKIGAPSRRFLLK